MDRPIAILMSILERTIVVMLMFSSLTLRSAPKIQIYSSDEVTACTKAFVVLAVKSNLRFGFGPTTVVLASPGKMRGALEGAGFPAKILQQSIGLVDELLSDHRIADPILRQTVAAMQTANENNLLYAVVGGKRSLRRTAFHVPGDIPFGIVPFKSGPNQARPKLTDHPSVEALRHGNEAIPDLVATNQLGIGTPGQGVGWFEDFIHENTHHADIWLLANWIEANRKLLRAGEQPDTLYREYVRISGGEIEVDEGFVRVFLETRAEKAGFEALKWLEHHFELPSDPQAQAEGEKQARLNAWRAINYRTFVQRITFQPALTKPAIAALKINQNNVFEVAELFGRTIDETLHRAKEVRSDQPGMALTVAGGTRRTISYHDLQSILGPSAFIDRPTMFRPYQLGDLPFSIPLGSIDLARNALLREGGELLYTEEKGQFARLAGRGGIFHGRSFFGVTEDGVPYIALGSLSDKTELKAYMSLFYQWQERRDALMEEGQSKVEAGRHAWLENQTPVGAYKSRKRAVAEAYGSMGSGLIPRTVAKVQAGRKLGNDEAEDLTDVVTRPNMKAIIKVMLLLKGARNSTPPAKTEPLPASSSGNTLPASLADMDSQFSAMAAWLADEALAAAYLIDSRRKNPQLRFGQPAPSDISSVLYGLLVYNQGGRWLEKEEIDTPLIALLVERDRLWRARFSQGTVPSDLSPLAVRLNDRLRIEGP